MTTFFKSKAAKAVVGLLALAVFAVAGSAHAYTFTQALKLGSTNAEVLALQQTLNANGFTVSATGAGAPGMESTYFGAKTQAAVQAFQAAKGIVSSGTPATTGFGQVGPATRAALNVLGTSTTLPAGCTSTSGFSSTTGVSCATGVSTGTLPAGCSSTLGYSPTTGLSCAGTVQNQTGPITASLSTTNPASGVIVAGQATAKLLDVTFSGSGTVSSVTLKRTGISDQSTLRNVYLYDGVTRLTDGYSFNNNGDIIINNLNLAVNGSRTVSVTADVDSISAISGQTVAVSLTGFTSGTSVSTVTIQGNTMSVASGSTLASVTFPSAQSVTAATVNAGTSSYAIYRQALQVNLRTVWLKAANFRITGSAPAGAVANAGLYIDGVKVGNNANMTMTNGSNYLSFDLSAAPFALTTGSHTMEIRADIVAGSSYNFTVSLQQASDLMIMDPQVGVNIAVTSFTTSAGAIITIGAGSSTIVLDPTFSTFTNITGGSSNATIAKFKVHGYGEDVKVYNLTVTPILTNACTAGSTYSSAPCNVTTGAGATQFSAGNGLQNVTLYFNGSQVGSQQTWNSGALTFSLGSQLIIPAGTDSTIEVRADLRSTGGVVTGSVSGQNYTAGIVSASVSAAAGNMEGVTSHTAPISGLASPAGTQLTIQTGLLAVAKNTGYANQSVNPNTAGTKIGSFVLQNQSSSESVRVTSLAVGLTTDGTTPLTTVSAPALTNFSGLRTSETSGSGSVPVQPQAANNFSVDFTLLPGATKIVDIFADTSAAVTGNVVTTLVVNAIGSSSNTSITAPSTGTTAGQTIGLSAGTLATPTLIGASTTSAQYIAAGDPMMTGTGAADGSKASYTFVSTGGASTISELKFTISGSATNPVMSVRVGSVTAPVVGGVAWLQGLNLLVPNGGSGLTVDAFITYAPVGTSGVTPATTSVTTLTYIKSNSGGTTSVSNPSVASYAITLVGSKPTVTIPSTTDSGLVVSSAVQKIGKVTISADSKGAVKINTLVFTVSTSGASTPATAVATPYIALTGTTTSIGSTACTAASLVVTCKMDADANASLTNFDGYQITAGSSQTFDLYGGLTAFANTGSGIPTVSTSVGQSTFNWDDSSTNGATGTNLSGALIYNFPQNSYSIKQ